MLMTIRKTDGSRAGRALAVALLFAGLATVGVWRLAKAAPGIHAAADASQQSAPAALREDLDVDEKSTIALFKRASPAVVNITNLALYRQGFRMTATEVPQGSCSGFLWDERGNVVTNFHVINNGSKFKVTLADGSDWDATVVGGSPDHDIAVLHIDAPRARLTALAIGTSSGLAVGQKVFAIGNPFGLDQTLTTGIISGLGREIRSLSDRKISDVIQTDAAINPGNSGGPLLDSAGRLIGINTAIVSPSGAYAGIGFAVPVDNAARIIPQLISRGQVSRPGLGINYLTNAQARSLGLKGVVVSDVSPDGGAKEAGLRPAVRYDDGSMDLDVIVSMDGKAIGKVEDLFDLLDQHAVGDIVRLVVRRGSKQVEVPVKLREIRE